MTPGYEGDGRGIIQMTKDRRKEASSDFRSGTRLTSGGRRVIAGTASYGVRDLEMLGDLMGKGGIRTVIDRTYSMDDIPRPIGTWREARRRVMWSSS